MSKISRRDFLRMVAVGMGAVTLGKFLEACSPSPASPTASPVSTPLNLKAMATRPAANGAPAATNTASAQTTNATSAPAPTAQGIPDMVVARNGEPEALVRAALAALGGMELFVPKGANVVVKPNICVAYHTYEYAATTNPGWWVRW